MEPQTWRNSIANQGKIFDCHSIVHVMSRIQSKTSIWLALKFKKPYVTSMSFQLELLIWSHVAGQQIPCFDRCQLVIIWTSNVKEVHSKPRAHVSVNLLFCVWQPSCTTPLPPSTPLPSCAVVSKTTSHDIS